MEENQKSKKRSTSEYAKDTERAGADSWGWGSEGRVTRTWELRGGARRLGTPTPRALLGCGGPDLWAGTLGGTTRLLLGLPKEVRTGAGGLVPQHVGRSACRQNPVTREPLLTEGCPRRRQHHRRTDLAAGPHRRMDGQGPSA